jgi:glutathione S-transferase
MPTGTEHYLKFYDCQTAPSPRRVRIFLAEKGMVLPTVQVDLRHGEQLTSAFRALNPWCTVPVLELDDGSAISEAIAICHYLEAIHPEPALMGQTPAEKAVILMWEHRCEIDGFLAVQEAFRNSAPGLKGRAVTGTEGVAQIPALAERGRARVLHFFRLLNQRLAASAYLGGPAYSVADITALVTVDFAGWIKLALPEDCVHARRWHAAVRQRPSATA